MSASTIEGSRGPPLCLVRVVKERAWRHARLRQVAKACRDFGQRVQFSMFEIEVDLAQWTRLRARLEDIIDDRTDSLRFYFLGANWERRIGHVGAKPAADFGGPLIV